MSVSDLRLVKPSAEWREALLDMAREVAAHGELRYSEALQDFEAYLLRLQNQAAGLDLAPGRVPQLAYWAADGDRLVGSSRIRCRLTPELEESGGHIGYDVRPSCRGQGYATRILALSLDAARVLGLNGVWVNCLSDNTASARVIQKNGGRLVDARLVEDLGKEISRYWMDLSSLRTSGGEE